MCRYRNCQIRHCHINLSLANPLGATRLGYCSVTHAILGLLDILETRKPEHTAGDRERDNLRIEARQAIEDLDVLRMESQR